MVLYAYIKTTKGDAMELKKCNKCGEEKPLADFHKHKNAPDGLRYSCKQCGNVRLAEYRKNNAAKYNAMMKKYRQKNRGRIREFEQTPARKEYMRKWRQKPEIKERTAARQRKYRDKNREKAALIQRKSVLKNVYGVSLDWYDSKLKEQDSGCAICGSLTPQRVGTKHFSVDHNHSTGENRGLLCVKCNTLIGYANENPNILKSAIAYIEKHNN
jgi:ribosomal protein S27AE